MPLFPGAGRIVRAAWPLPLRAELFPIRHRSHSRAWRSEGRRARGVAHLPLRAVGWLRRGCRAAGEGQSCTEHLQLHVWLQFQFEIALF